VILINILITFAGIVVLELIFGNWLNPDTLNKLNIIRGRRFTFAVGDLYETDRETVTYSRDTWGLRGSFTDPSEITILTVGGSTTDQRYITDGETWQDVIQNTLQKQGMAATVANAGVDGQSTLGHILNFEWWFPNIPGLKPDYILFFIGLNDFYKDEGVEFISLVRDKSGTSLLQLIRERSVLYHIGRTLKGLYQARVQYNIVHRSVDFDSISYTSHPLQHEYRALMGARLREYGQRLDVLVGKTRAMGAEPVFVTQPSRKYRLTENGIEGFEEPFDYSGHQINGVDYYYMMQLIDSVTCERAAAHSCICIDVASNMISEWKDDDFYDFAHMTPSGAEKMGTYIGGVLLECLRTGDGSPESR